jgi:hypothetical protein
MLRAKLPRDERIGFAEVAPELRGVMQVATH